MDFVADNATLVVWVTCAVVYTAYRMTFGPLFTRGAARRHVHALARSLNVTIYDLHLTVACGSA